MGRNQALQEVAADRDRNVIESTFIRIGDINSNTFLEKRDNKYYVVKVNDNGEFVEADPTSVNLFGSVQARNSKGRTEFVVAQRKDKAISVNKVDINLQPELKDVEIDGILVDMNGQTMTTQEFIMYQRIVPLLKEIENKKYYTRIDNGIDPFYGLKGVFFVGPGDVDTRGKEFDFDLLKQELAEGHAIANHSWSHDYHVLYPNRTLNLDNFLADFKKTDDLLKKGYSVWYFKTYNDYDITNVTN